MDEDEKAGVRKAAREGALSSLRFGRVMARVLGGLGVKAKPPVPADYAKAGADLWDKADRGLVGNGDPEAARVAKLYAEGLMAFEHDEGKA